LNVEGLVMIIKTNVYNFFDGFQSISTEEFHVLTLNLLLFFIFAFPLLAMNKKDDGVMKLILIIQSNALYGQISSYKNQRVF
jgi:hypothetical protein